MQYKIIRKFKQNMSIKINFLSVIWRTVIVIITLNAIPSYALTDTLQVKLLHKAQEYINPNDSHGQHITAKIDSLLHVSHLSDSAYVSFLVRDIGEYFRRQGLQSNAIELFSVAVADMERQKARPELIMKIYLPLGAAFEEVGLWSSAMEYYHKALTIAQENNMQGNIARIYNNIGVAYYRSDLETSKVYLYKSLEINNEIGDKQELFRNYNNLAAVYMKQNSYKEALDYALQGLQLIDKYKNSDLYYSMMCNIGLLYTESGEYTLGISYLLNARDFFKTTDNPSELISVYVILLDAYEKTGQTDLAMQCAMTIENDILHKLSNSEIESNIRTRLASIYSQNGNYKKAYEYLQIASSLKDSLTLANDARKINNLEQIYDNEQKLRENNRIIKDMQINKLENDRRVTALVMALIAIIAIIIFLFIRSQLQQKLLKTKNQLAEQQALTQEKEKELQQIKERELNQAIDRKNRELSSYALSYTRDNEFMQQLGEELKQLLTEINPRDKQHKEHIRSILTKLKQHTSSNNWQEFRYFFEQVHPSFYDHLDELCPGITQRQKRLCAMLYIGLSTKEISSITFREIRSIESARNRLRKKMNIPTEESIQDFLSRKLLDLGQ